MMRDTFNLRRFIEAQEPVLENVYAELRSGSKTTHWMWFTFPQIKGLGGSAMAQKYAITSLAEARAYLKLPVLGPRLIECTHLVNALKGRTVDQIFGNPDDLKFRSSMTLFAKAAPNNAVFEEALQKYFGGEPDFLTLEKL